MFQIGANPLLTNAVAQYGLGMRHVDQLGREYVYVKATEVVTAGMCCIISGAWAAEGVTATNAAHDAGAGSLCGLAVCAFADNDYGWLAVKGTGADFLCNLVGVADDFQPLGPTSTAGALDNQDAGSATAPRLNGWVITTASAGAEQEVCILNYPSLETDYPA